MEHSRLLKFLTEERYRKIMADAPPIKIQRDYENPPNISAEVPGEQRIREVDSNYQESDIDTNTSSEVTDTEHTLSPVITITKNETTLTKGDSKLQKITVTENIAPQEVENEGHRISYAELETGTNKQTDTINVSTAHRRKAKEARLHTGEKNHDPKKSRIPQMKFKQTVEKVQKEIQEHTRKDQHKPRRSSIPRLKDAKNIKRQTSLKAEQKVEVEDEFEKIYEEIVVDKQNDIDDKILAVKVDDSEIVDSIFDEIIHAYDSNDDNYLIHTEKLKSSKIPYRKKSNTANKIGSENVDKKKDLVANSNLKDGGFKVSATTITTKRFSRGNSMDENKTRKLEVAKNSNIHDCKDKDVIEKEVTTEVIDIRKTNATVQSVAETNRTGVISKNKHFEDSHKENITRIPVKPERINRNISRELNRRPAKLDDRDFVNREVLKYEDYNDGTSKMTVQETIVKEPEIKIENVTRSISRTFSRDGKSITVSPKSKQAYNDNNKVPNIETTSVDNNESETLTIIPSQEIKYNKKEDSANTVKQTQFPIPVIPKTTHNYSKGRIYNVERSKSIEWKSADEGLTKKYVRSYSEKRFTEPEIGYKIDEQSIRETVTIKPEIIDINNDTKSIQIPKEFNKTEAIISDEQDAIPNSMSLEIPKKAMVISSEINQELSSQKEVNYNDENKDSTIANVTILKGNVSRLISQLHVKDTIDVPKTEIDVQEDLPEKKSVLSKIAVFEGKEPADVTIKIKKCTLDKTVAALDKIENTEEPVKSVHVKYNDVPVIVDQIMKFQEQNVSIMHQVIDIKVLPEAIDFVVSESNTEISETFPNQQDTNTETDKKLPAEIAVKINELYTEESRSLSEKLHFEGHNVTTSPANVNLFSNKNKDTIVKYSPEKAITKNKDYQSEVQKPKIGKLNLDLWNKQVEINKQLLNKGKYTNPSETQITTPKTTKTLHNIETNEMDNGPLLQEIDEKINASNKEKVSVTLTENEDYTFDNSENTETEKSEVYYEMPAILPFERDTISSVSLTEEPKTKEGRHQVTVVLPETRAVKLDFETKDEQFDNPVNLLCLTPVNTPTTPSIIRENINFVTSKNSAKDTNHSYIPNSVDSFEKADQFEARSTKDNNNTDDLDKDVPSDPELVDSESELKDNKSTIMDRLRNKLYLITSRNINKNKTDNLEDKSFSPNDSDEYIYKDKVNPVLNYNSVHINNNEVRNAQYNTASRNYFNNKTNIVRNNIQDIEYDRNENRSRVDLKRTKSLAELDIGDVVKGQVRRMVYRIKSVDFGKMEAIRTNKISDREMPKKSSVLEKIALFEGKANSTTPAQTIQNESTTVSNNKTQVENQSQTILEQTYLQKIEELSTAKMRYNKTTTLYLKLGNGALMPSVGLGTALLDPRLAPHIVAAAIDLGYRAFDTAYIYGTEQAVGQGIKMKIDDGTVTREQLFVSGKLWSTFHKPELVETACRTSLESLGLDYFDLYMIHNPISLKEGGAPIPQIAKVLQFSQYDYMDAWFAMEALVSKGLVRALGVSNFNSQQIQKIIDKGHVRPVVNQVECHPYLTQEQLHQFCSARNITLSCYSVLGSKGTPAEYKTGLKPAIDDALIKVMGLGMKVTPAQLLVRYQIQSGRQAVVKASTPEHLWENLQAFTFVLEPHQINAINNLNKNQRNFDMKMFGEFNKNYPFNIAF